ncbi:MAG: riboflavin biosynthesis protein RibF [Synergistaceae bacterium]|jgi:riboflavin kinase/FMN adenylyltransferase|nr:riboflavin biosynthesis protein RibF [Synergistaceae bacterium]
MIAVLGAFDGFHRGHALLFERAKALAKPRELEWGAVTFDPHPGVFLGNLDATLFTFRERELIQIFLGIPRVVTLEFDDDLVHSPPSLFWEFLSLNVDIDGVVVGRDFRFGYRRTGDVTLLEHYCREAGVDFLAVDPLEHFGTKISSTAVRELVSSGECGLAAKKLGYPYFVWAEIEHGLGRGKELGYPTANLSVPSRKLLPANGVYAVALIVKGQWKAGALSLGDNPTFDDVQDRRAEVFILDYEGDLYGESFPVLFLFRLRPQVQFKNAEQLVLQIDADVKRAHDTFRHGFKANSALHAAFKTAYLKVLAKGKEQAS